MPIDSIIVLVVCGVVFIGGFVLINMAQNRDKDGQ